MKRQIGLVLIGLLLCTGGYAQIYRAYAFQDGLARIQTNQGHCYIDKTGKRVTSFYADAHNFYEGLAAVKINGKWSFIDPSCKLAVEGPFDEISDFSEGLAAVKSGDRWSFIDKQGTVVIRLSTGYIANSFREGLALIYKQNDNCAYIDPAGKEIITVKCQRASSFSNGFATLFIDGNKGYVCIDKTGKEIPRPEPAQSPGEPIMERRDGYYGYVDGNGKVVIPFQYSKAQPFEHGVAYVETTKSRGGYTQTSINRNPIGTQTSQGEYHTTTMSTSYVAGGRSTQGFRIDRKGRKLKYDTYFPMGHKSYSEGLWCITQNRKKFGYMDDNNKIVIPVNYSEIGAFSEGLAIVRKGDSEWLIIDKQGNKVADVNL